MDKGKLIRGDFMNLEELKAALDRIPDHGAINKARRLHIQKMIFELIRSNR